MKHMAFFYFLKGDPGVPGFKGEAGPKGEPVSNCVFIAFMFRKYTFAR